MKNPLISFESFFVVGGFIILLAAGSLLVSSQRVHTSTAKINWSEARTLSKSRMSLHELQVADDRQ